MEEKKKDIVIISKDEVSIGDGFGSNIDRKSPFRGFVEIYEVDEQEKKKLIGKQNLVVYLGREWSAARIFNVDNVNILPTKDEFICWVGLGTGGTAFGDPFDPAPPSSINTDLNNPIPINLTDSIHCGDLREDGYYKLRIGNDDPENPNIVYEQDSNNSNSWLITRILVTVGQGDAINSQISEAGLFTAVSNEGGFNGDFHLFARVTFPSVYKDATRQLILVWYIYS